MARIAFQTLMRAAAVSLLTDYAAAESLRLQVYPGRPRSVNPPTAFVDAIRETISYTALNQRSPIADVIVVHGIFDSKEAADQKDAFVDGFIDYVMDRYHAPGANTLAVITETEDLPDYVPEWMPPNEQRTYYATRISLEGLALSG
jgi:hypothetical protein